MWLATPSSVMANSLLQTATTSDPYASLAAGISTGLAAIGAGIAVSGTGAAAVGYHCRETRVLWPFPDLCGPGRRDCDLRVDYFLHGIEPVREDESYCDWSSRSCARLCIGWCLQGQAASSVDEVNHALDEALSAEDIGIILVTEDVSVLIEERMDQLKLRSTVPLVVEIPGPQGTSPDRPIIECRYPTCHRREDIRWLGDEQWCLKKKVFE